MLLLIFLQQSDPPQHPHDVTNWTLVVLLGVIAAIAIMRSSYCAWRDAQIRRDD